MQHKRRKDYGLKQDQRGVWRCDFSVAGKRIQRSTFTTSRAQAEEWCAAIATDTWREIKLGEAPPVKWDEASAAYILAGERNGKGNLANERALAVVFGKHFDGRWLHTLTTEEVNSMLNAEGAARGWANATFNRYRSYFMGVMALMREQKRRLPDVTIPHLKEPTERVRWLTKAEAAELLKQLPLRIRRIAEFSLLTGMRQSEVTGLRWRDVDLERRLAWVTAVRSKSRKAMSKPLSARAIEILREAKACERHGSDVFVFTNCGQPICQPANHAWYAALKRAKIEDFHWHDLRHTWASWHVMGWWSSTGTPTPLPVLQQLGGWADIKLVMRYAHVGEDFTAQYVGDVGVAPTVERPALAVVGGTGA